MPKARHRRLQYQHLLHQLLTANVSPSFATAPTFSLTTLESTLGQIEIKVYGVKKGDMPIIQRLEKLEQDTNSKIGTGSIADRIQTLAKTYGI